MKKTILLIFTLTLLLGLVACGGAPSQSTADQGDAQGDASDPGADAPALPDADTQTNYNINATASEAADTGEGVYGGAVRINDIQTDFHEPFGLVWIPTIARQVMTPFAEDLVNFTMAGEYEPHLAESWVIDQEKKTITFKLKEGITFTDDSPFNAEAVRWNMEAWHEDSRGNEEIDPGMVKVIDDYTVEITYNNWQNVLFETFASHTYAMVSMDNYLKNGKDYARNNPVGTGPYIMTEWDRGTSVTFEKNEDYWQEGKPYLDRVQYFGIQDVMVQNAAMISNNPADRIDAFQITNAEQAWQLMNTPGLDFDTSYRRGSGTFVLCPNTVDEENNPLYDVRVRNAISYAINREDLCEALGYGIWQPANQLTSAEYAGHLPDDNPYLAQGSYDPEKAKALLAEAGYPDGFTIPLRALVQFQDACVAIAGMLEQVGIHCELEFPEAGRILELQMNGWDGLIGFNFGQVMNTGISYYIWWHPDVTSYVSAMRPPEYEDMYYTARRSYEIDNGLFGDLGELALANQVFVPIYHQYTSFFIRNGLTNSGFKEYSADTMWTPWNAYWAEDTAE